MDYRLNLFRDKHTRALGQHSLLDTGGGGGYLGRTDAEVNENLGRLLRGTKLRSIRVCSNIYGLDSRNKEPLTMDEIKLIAEKFNAQIANVNFFV